MSETQGLNIRFLAQGMLKLAPEQLPPGFFDWRRADQIKWASDFWEERSRQELLAAVAYLVLEEDSVPDCLEVDNEDYTILAQTPAWKAFNLIGASTLVDPEDANEKKDLFREGG